MKCPSQQSPRRNPAAWLRAGRALCLCAGVALCTAFAAAQVDGAIGRQAAIRDFRDFARTPPPDQSNWSERRRQEYAAAISVAAEPPVAVLTIPALGLEVPVFARDDALSLNRGAALIAGMSAPDAGGNLGIAGHRDGFFRALRDIRAGDLIEVRTHRASHRYRVSAMHIVGMEDGRLLADTDMPTVTLVTCYPFHYIGNAPQRFVITGEYLWNDPT